MKDSKKIVVIGAGFAGLAAAAKLAQAGHDVHLIEKTTKPVVEQEFGKKMDLLSTWDQVGIGCPKFLTISLKNLAKKQQIFMN